MVDEVSERLARILDRTGDYRILRRVPAPAPSHASNADRTAAGLVTGIVLDTETTGLGSDDEVIELGMAAFAYEPTLLRVDHVIDTFSALRQPSRPIPPDVRRLTGITDADVAGRAIDPAAVARCIGGAQMARRRAAATCCRCGALGRLRLDRSGWPTTRCDAHVVRGRPW